MKKSKEDIKTDINRMLLISRSHYDVWFSFWLLRAPNEVGSEQANLNLKIYKDFGQLFVTTEESVLTSFSVIFSQLFDSRKDVVSLYSLNKEFNSGLEKEIDNLRKSDVVEKILKMRMKFFAHNDITGKYIKRVMPSDNDIEKLFNDICSLFNKITGQVIIHHVVAGQELVALFKTIEKSNPRRFKL